jgi:hypothetical protein
MERYIVDNILVVVVVVVWIVVVGLWWVASSVTQKTNRVAAGNTEKMPRSITWICCSS